MHFLMRKPNPSSENGNVTTFCSGRRFFDVFSVSWKFYRENFLHTASIRDLLIRTHLLNYNMWYFQQGRRFGPSKRDATATRMTKYWNSLNRWKRSFIPPLIIPETCRLIQDIASRTPPAFPRFLQTLCLNFCHTTDSTWTDLQTLERLAVLLYHTLTICITFICVECVDMNIHLPSLVPMTGTSPTQATPSILLPNDITRSLTAVHSHLIEVISTISHPSL